MKLITHEHERIGQHIFNFLAWLNQEKGFDTEWFECHQTDGRMADPFNIEDDKFIELYNQYVNDKIRPKSSQEEEA